jgi:hypothetical protein
MIGFKPGQIVAIFGYSGPRKFVAMPASRALSDSISGSLNGVEIRVSESAPRDLKLVGYILLSKGFLHIHPDNLRVLMIEIEKHNAWIVHDAERQNG